MAEEAHGDDEHAAIAHFGVVDELAVVPPALVGACDGDVFHHLAVFELHDGRVAVAFAMVLGHDVERFLVAVVGHEPSGGLATCQLVLSS